MRKLDAPWSTKEVAALAAYQRRDDVHPYTCPNEHPGETVLIPTREGFVCPDCEYMQTWAHAEHAR